ncbi:MAG: hypothetical protein ACK2VA_11255 [Anaerolineae bacterium]
MFRLPGRSIWSCTCYLVLAFSLLTACTATMVAQDPPTPTPEVFIPRTAVVPEGATIAGRVLWGSTPMAGAKVELRKGAWADPAASETIAQTVADADGAYELEAPPSGGAFGLVALWPDGSTNTASVTPVQVAAGDARIPADVYLAKDLDWVDPAFDAEVYPTATLRWSAMPGVSQYRLWVVDAGTSELVYEQTLAANGEAWQGTVSSPLTQGRSYTWEVQGLDADGNLLARHTSAFRVTTQAADFPADLPERCHIWGYDNYVDRTNGFCFAYPPLFAAQVNEAGNPVLYGPALDGSVEPLRASLLIEVQVAAENKTLEEIVDGYLAQFDGMNIPPIVRTELELDGQPAVMLEVVPGREGSRDLFMLHNGTLFHMMFMPSTMDFPQAKTDVELLFNGVVNSFGLIAGNAGPGGQPVPPVSDDLVYSRVSIAEAGLTAEIPAGWLRLEPQWTWTPAEDSDIQLGIRWATLQPPQEAEAALLPAPAQVLQSDPLALSWGSGRLVTLEVYATAPVDGKAAVQSVERHALVVIEQNGARRAFDLYAVAPTQEALEGLDPLLQHMLDTSKL